MQAATGFSDDGQGTTHYIDTCKKNGLLPVGSGTFSYNCDRNRYDDEPCIPMPDSWGSSSDMLSSLNTNTGWGNNIVAMQDDGKRNADLYKPGQQPTGNENLQAVCGKVTGISHNEYHCDFARKIYNELSGQ